ncbi:MAG: DRTGG domain-containing protein, partial [Dehalococcoidia bacterium]|nr:DRTGG domain-containing protein [Dehalococcoidia bacterium]
DTIYRAYQELKKGKDAVVIGGGQDLFDGFSVGVSNIHFIEKYDLPLLLVDSPVFGEINIDMIMAMHDRFKDKLTGIILNNIPPHQIHFINKYIVPFLTKQGIKVRGIIPVNPKLSSLSISEIKDILGGNIICCEGKEGEIIENFMVGAMNVEGALKYFRSQPNKAVVTGGDRADIQLAALETSTKLLILTGGLYPNSLIITAAREKNVPIMVAGDDTLTVVSKMGAAVGKVSIKGTRIGESLSTFNKYIDKTYLKQLAAQAI